MAIIKFRRINVMKLFEYLDRLIERVTTVSLVVTILSIFSLSLLSIVLRWVQASPLWIDPLVRHLVFLSAFLAGILTTGKGKHLAIDLVSKYLEHQKQYQRRVQRLITLASIGGIGWLTYASIEFLKSEMEFGKMAFLNIHSAFWVSIIPIGFTLIAYRFFYIFLTTFKKEEVC